MEIHNIKWNIELYVESFSQTGEMNAFSLYKDKMKYGNYWLFFLGETEVSNEL